MRSALLVREKAGKAAFAAATARSTSPALPMLICATGSSVAGLITSKGCGCSGATHSPLM